MFNICEKNICCGCSACMNVCPKKCITMKISEEGFLYPEIDNIRCIKCDLCKKTCPVNNLPNGNSVINSVIARTKKNDQLKNSTSGGVSTSIAENFFMKGGDVFGAKFDKHFELHHEKAKCLEDIYAFSGSKYIQSDISKVLNEIKRNMLQEKDTLFIGTPCQVAAVRNIIGVNEHLYLIDFVCRAVPSPLVFREYLNIMKARYKSIPVNVIFREKTYGYHNTTMTILYKNGKKYRKSGRIDIYHKLFFDSLSIRKSCEKCPFRKEERTSDLTLFEAWKATKFLPDNNDDNKGYGSVLIRTEKGRKLLEICMADLDCYESNTNFIIANDGFYLKNAIPCNKNRDGFFKSFKNDGLEIAVKKYVKISTIDKLFECCKPALYKMGILVRIKKVKEKIEKH